MRAFVVQAKERGGVREVDSPTPGPGQVAIDVQRAGVCGTDVSLYFGDDERIRRARSHHPLRLGHEWAGVVSALGPGVEARWLGRRVTGDTMIGCGHCQRCRSGFHHLCEDRYEVGVRRDWPGALAERFVMPVDSLFVLPESVTWEMGALVEPGANAYRAVHATQAPPGARVLVIGPGTIGLLCAWFADAAGLDVDIVGVTKPSLDFAREVGIGRASTIEDLPDVEWDAVIDASTGAEAPALAVRSVRPGGRVVLIGIAEQPSEVDTRVLVRKEATATGVLGGSLGLQATIDAYASGAVNPLPLISRTVGLEDLDALFAAGMPQVEGRGPKTLVDPTRH
ncbi:zinc-dependent alcohol dehydrogenase [Actinopolymorpha pittospori]